MNNIIIPERFEKEIVIHALRVLKKVNNAPIMLSIEGPTGTGKTFQCETVLKRMGIEPIVLSAGMFEDKEAGEPARKLREAYNNAVELTEADQAHPKALIIDDADVAFGEWKQNTQYTVNTQQVIGELMQIANSSTDVHVARIPIYLTGNDISKIYAPLRRTGRMNFFYWKPSAEEKLSMVYPLFEKWISIHECRELIKYADYQCKKHSLEESSIALFSTIATFVYDDYLWESYIYAKANCFDGTIIANITGELNSKAFTWIDLRFLVDYHIEQIKKSRVNYLPVTNKAVSINTQILALEMHN